MVLQEHMESLFTEDVELQKKTFSKLKKIIQDYILYKVWINKGGLLGIHFDFGRHSYFRTNEIGSYYHLNDEDRINLILKAQEHFSGRF